MKTCPICGFEGDGALCPNDGALLLTEADLAEPAATQIGHAPEGLEATRAESPMPVELAGHPLHDEIDQMEATRAEASVPAELAGTGDEEEEDSTQAPGPTPDREHPDVVQVDHEAMRGKDFGQWAEPKVKKKPRKDPMIGRTVAGRYEIIGLLGKGGMGAVYKARQPAVQRMIALKVLLQEFTNNETVIRRFHQEALAASRLTHPNTIKVYDFGQTEDGILYIAMEYLRGQSLAQAQGRGQPMPPKRVIHIMRQVCKSLAEAHKNGIIHRDLKPDNIFLEDIQGERDYVKVLDFGVAKLKEFEGKEGTLTQAGMIFGTPKYMSPEQARSGKLDARSDVYALGVILYECLVGRAPFVGENPLSILIAHVNERPPPFKAINPAVSIPPALEAVVFKALAKRREERQAGVDELSIELDAIDQLLDGASYESVAARLPGVLPGADGSPSLVGPAIVPAGSDDTQGPVGSSGNTVRLDAEGNPLGAIVALEETPPEPVAAPGGFPWWTLAAAVPVLGLGVWFFMHGPAEGPRDAGAPVSVARLDVDGGGAPPPQVDRGVAPPTGPTAPPTTTPESVASAAPATVPGREFLLRSDPDKARVLDFKTGEEVGQTYMRVTISEPTTYIFRKTGYLDKRVLLSPEDADTQKKIVLEPKPEAVRPAAPETKVVVVRPPPVSPGTKPPAAPRTDTPIELQ